MSFISVVLTLSFSRTSPFGEGEMYPVLNKCTSTVQVFLPKREKFVQKFLFLDFALFKKRKRGKFTLFG